jgi:hypothetical protein
VSHNRRFVSSRLVSETPMDDASRRRARVHMATVTTTTAATGTAALTRAKSSAMVMNMLRVAMYTVTHCRGAFFGLNE